MSPETGFGKQVSFVTFSVIQGSQWAQDTGNKGSQGTLFHREGSQAVRQSEWLMTERPAGGAMRREQGDKARSLSVHFLEALEDRLPLSNARLHPRAISGN